MSRNRNNNNSIWKTIKDYAVPFIWLVLILVLLYSVFSSWSNDNNPNQQSDSNIESTESKITLSPEDSLAYVVYDSWKKVQIEESFSLWKLEKIVVESWSVLMDFPSVAKMKLSENWEFTYKEDWSFYLESWDLWVEPFKDLDISMKYANALLSVWSVSNLNQNEIESSLYSLLWRTSLSNLVWITSSVGNWEKLWIKSIDSASNDIDLDSYKTPIDDYFKLSEWFNSNWWEEVLSKNITESEIEFNSTWSLLIEEDTSSLITFDDITDESYVNSNPIDLKWRYSISRVWNISINGKDVILNKDLWVFSLKWFSLAYSTNDLVIKIFDNNKNVIWKEVLTLYSNKTVSWLPSIDNSTTTSSGLENFSVKPTDFYIYEPTKTWKITTTSPRITIRWSVSNKNVANVSVNDYTLKSYNWSTWRYHAFVEQNTLKDWANNYEIKYVDSDWNIVYKEYYSIYKEKASVATTTPVVEKETSLISSEVWID